MQMRLQEAFNNLRVKYRQHIGVGKGRPPEATHRPLTPFSHTYIDNHCEVLGCDCRPPVELQPPQTPPSSRASSFSSRSSSPSRPWSLASSTSTLRRHALVIKAGAPARARANIAEAQVLERVRAHVGGSEPLLLLLSRLCSVGCPFLYLRLCFSYILVVFMFFYLFRAWPKIPVHTLSAHPSSHMTKRGRPLVPARLPLPHDKSIPLMGAANDHSITPFSTTAPTRHGHPRQKCRQQRCYIAPRACATHQYRPSARTG